MEPYRERIEDFMRRWRSQYEGNRVFRVLVITVVLAALGVTSAGLSQTPTYEASAQMLVGEAPPAQGKGIQLIPLAPMPGEVQEDVQAMAGAIDTRPVAEEVIQRLELQMGAAELLDNLTVEPVEDSFFIELTCESTDPVKATKIVNTVSQVSSELISESSIGWTATVWEEAEVPESPVSPKPLRNGLLTLVIGLVFCTGAVVVWPGFGARIAGTLGERPSRQGIGQAGVLGRDRSIVERVKEKKLLLALGRRGKLTAIEAALESELSVEEAERMLFDLAAQGQLEVTVEGSTLFYSFWARHEH